MTINTSDFLYPPEDIQDLSAPGAAQKIQYTFDLIFAQLRKLREDVDEGGGSSSGAAEHDILSATHSDVTVAAAADGDILIRSGSKWIRLAKGTDGHFLQLVAGIPAWGVDGTALSIDHDLLDGSRHPDTEAATPQLGDTIQAQNAGSIEHSPYWIDGEAVEIIPTADDPSGAQYWLDGLPMAGLVSSGEVKWQRKAIGGSGTVPVSNGVTWDWQDVAAVAGAGIGVSAYQGGDVSHSSTTPPSEQQISFSAVEYDTSGFWSSGTPNRLTVPSGADGLYAIYGMTALPVALGTGAGQLILKVNGTEIARGPVFGYNTTYTPNAGFVAKQVQLEVGDYVEMFFQFEHVANPSITLEGGATNTFLQLAKV